MTRSDEPLFDPRIADWLEDDPYAAPDQALDVVLAAFKSIKQRRASHVPRRLNMNAPLRIAAAVVAIMAVGLGAYYVLAPGRPSGSGAGPASQSPTTPLPSPSSSAPMPIGTVTLTESSCTFEALVDPLPVGVTAISATNKATSFSGIDLFRVRDGFSFQDIQTHVDDENARIQRGEDYLGFPEAGTSITQLPLQVNETASMSFIAAEGTYGVVCVRGIREPGNPDAYYAVGPIEIRLP